MEPPRILLLSTEPGPGSGAYRMLEHLLGSAGESRPRLLVVAPAGSGVFASAVAAGVETREWPATRDAALAHLRAARSLVLPAGVGVVHAWHSRGFEAALLLARRLGSAASATLHDHPVQTAHRPVRRLLMRAAARRMDALVSVGRNLAEAWNPFAGRAPITVIPNGIPDAPPPARPASTRVRVGFAGLYSPVVKGWPVVRGWMETARREGWPVEWRLYGARDNPPRAPGLDPAAATVRGFAPTASIFAECDVLVHPSQWFDSYPTLLLEAARAGVPVVASDRGGSAEIVRDGATGWVFPADQPDEGLARLRALVGDAARRERMGAAARVDFLARHRPDRMVAAYGSFWDEVTARAPRADRPAPRRADHAAGAIPRSSSR